MPAAVAIPAIASAVAGIGGAAISAHGSGKAAQRTTDAANHAADVEAASARDALDFQKQEAERTATQVEADRHANYDQWAAFMNAHNAARQKYGYSTTAIPGYVPGVTPKYTSPGAALMGQPPIAANPNSGAVNPRSVGAMLMPPISGTPYALARDPRVIDDPSRALATRPAPRSIGASLYGGR